MALRTRGGPRAKCGLTCPSCGSICERQHANSDRVTNHYHITPYPDYGKLEWRA